MEPNGEHARPWHHRIAGAAFFLLVHTLRLAPSALAYGLADLLAPLLVAVTFLGRRRGERKKRGFYRNTDVVFRGDMPHAIRRKLLWRWARHMTHLCVDVCKMPAVTRDNVGQYVDCEELQMLAEAHAGGRGAIAVSGHVGVYEFSSYLTATIGIPIVTVFRESPIPIVTDIINGLRGATGQRLVEREGAVRILLRALSSGEVLGLLADVSSKESEVFAPFLGVDAATSSTPGILHLKTGAPIVVLTTQRTARRRYRVHVWDRIEIRPTGNRSADLHAIAIRINAALTRAIVAYPEQWFWDSLRFRNRPEGEVRDERDRPPRVDAAPAHAIRERLRAAAPAPATPVTATR